MSNDEIPVYPDFVEGVLTFRMPADYDPGATSCVDCGREIRKDEMCLGDERGIHCAACSASAECETEGCDEATTAAIVTFDDGDTGRYCNGCADTYVELGLAVVRDGSPTP